MHTPEYASYHLLNVRSFGRGLLPLLSVFVFTIQHQHKKQVVVAII